jgi:hemerythrin-like domain-containing protein
MGSIGSYLKGDYALCNRLYYKTCEHLLLHAHALAATAMAEFVRALERHMQIEERIVFSAFDAMREDQATPTDTLRKEHMLIRDTVQRMWLALDAKHSQTFLLHADTLRIVLSQHAQKENFQLMPLVEQALALRQNELLLAMENFDVHQIRPNNPLPAPASAGPAAGAGHKLAEDK